MSSAIKLFSSVIFAMLLAVQVYADKLQTIEQQIEKPEKLLAQFSQAKHIAALSRPLVSTGKMWLVKNQGLAWLTESPIQSQVFITQNGISGIDTQGTLKNKAFEQIGALLNTLFNGDLAQLQEQFEINIISQNEQQWHIGLTPKSSIVQSFMQGIELKGSRYIESVLLLESESQKTQITFSSFNTDVEISQTVMDGFQ